MRKASPAPAGKFRDIVARIGAAFRAQREIDAKRVLRRYSHLLEQSHGTSRLNEMTLRRRVRLIGISPYR